MTLPKGGMMFVTLFGLPFDSHIIIVEDRHRFIYWLLVGLIAGWLAGKIARGRGFGCITDIVLGLIGAYLGGCVFAKLGIFGPAFLFSLSPPPLHPLTPLPFPHLFS